MVDLDPTWVLVAATVLLAVFTAALARTTKNLVKATLGLAKLEKDRERRVRLERKIRLIEDVIAIRPDAFRDAIAGGSLPTGSVEIRGLAPMLDPNGSPSQKDVWKILRALDEAGRGKLLAAASNDMQVLLITLKIVQDRLADRLSDWREELGELGAQA